MHPPTERFRMVQRCKTNTFEFGSAPKPIEVVEAESAKTQILSLKLGDQVKLVHIQLPDEKQINLNNKRIECTSTRRVETHSTGIACIALESLERFFLYSEDFFGQNAYTTFLQSVTKSECLPASGTLWTPCIQWSSIPTRAKIDLEEALFSHRKQESGSQTCKWKID